MPLFGREVTLFRVFGLPVKASPSWLLLVALIVFHLATDILPGITEEAYGPAMYTALGTLGAVGLFASLVCHELCHSLVARATGTPVSGITLFIFGGVSRLRDEPPTAATELLMAAVGPISSVLIGLGFLVLWVLGRRAGWHAGMLAVLHFLFWANFVLAAFNSAPAFPLDGGRILRSILWGATGNLQAATQVAAGVGSSFALLLMALGLLSVISGYLVQGLLALLVGFFLRQAAAGSLRMLAVRQQLLGRRLSDFMATEVVTVPEGCTVQDFVDRYVFRHRFSHYPVVDPEGTLAGLVNARAPRRVPPNQWPVTPVRSIMTLPDPDAIFGPDTDALEALAALQEREGSRGVVLVDGRPVGIVSLRDFLRYLALKLDLFPPRRSR
jgi:Zn-dependent protease/CBS domain-containing protein